MYGYIVFSDLTGFSKLTEPGLRSYYQCVLPELSQRIQPWVKKSEVFNTWGDGLVAIFKGGSDAVNFLLSYREFFASFSFQNLGVSSLVPRIGAHFGEFNLFDDPLLGRRNAIGSNLHTAARIEPITRPGEIFVTEAFKDAIERLSDPLQGIAFDSLGQFPLAKNFGRQDLFRLRGNHESSLDIDRILKQDLSNDLPEPEGIRPEEEANIQFFKNAPSADMFANMIKPLLQSSLEGVSGEYLFQIASLCLDFGQYDSAIDFVARLEAWPLVASKALLHPYQTDRRVWKLKADCLTRIGQYNKAANIVYGLWRMNPGDANILATLAGQYKRHALFGDGTTDNDPDTIDREKINGELLTRSCNLYVESFRRNMDSYYAAINAAYLYKILAGLQGGRGNKLAQHIIVTWENKKDQDWWVAASLAEAEVVLNDFENAIDRFRYAIETHKPNAFEKDATITQLRIHAALTDTRKETNAVLELLRGTGRR